MRSPTARRVVVPATIAAVTLTGDAFAAGLDPRHGGLDAWLVVGLVALLGVLLAVLALAAARGLVRSERALDDAGRELDELLQSSGSAAESQRLLIDNAERILPGAGCGVLLVWLERRSGRSPTLSPGCPTAAPPRTRSGGWWRTRVARSAPWAWCCSTSIASACSTTCTATATATRRWPQSAERVESADHSGHSAGPPG